MAPHSSTLAWKIPWTEEPGGLQSMGSRRVRHDLAPSLSLFIFMHWRRKWQPTPVFLPGESQGRGSLVGCHPVLHVMLPKAPAASADTLFPYWREWLVFPNVKMSPTLKSETVKDLSLTLLAKNTRALSQKPRPLFLGTNAAGRTASYIGSSSPHPSVSSGEGLMLLTYTGGYVKAEKYPR